MREVASEGWKIDRMAARSQLKKMGDSLAAARRDQAALINMRGSDGMSRLHH